MVGGGGVELHARLLAVAPADAYIGTDVAARAPSVTSRGELVMVTGDLAALYDRQCGRNPRPRHVALHCYREGTWHTIVPWVDLRGLPMIVDLLPDGRFILVGELDGARGLVEAVVITDDHSLDRHPLTRRRPADRVVIAADGTTWVAAGEIGSGPELRAACVDTAGRIWGVVDEAGDRVLARWDRDRDGGYAQTWPSVLPETGVGPSWRPPVMQAHRAGVRILLRRADGSVEVVDVDPRGTTTMTVRPGPDGPAGLDIRMVAVHGPHVFAGSAAGLWRYPAHGGPGRRIAFRTDTGRGRRTPSWTSSAWSTPECISSNDRRRTTYPNTTASTSRIWPISPTTTDDRAQDRMDPPADHPPRRSCCHHTRPATFAALLGWLRHRRQTWPHTANQHVLVSRTTALGIGPVTADYLERLLTLRIDLKWIRQDRILHEALTSDADPLQLALVFGIDHSTAMTYANLARQILTTDSEPTASTPSVHG